MNSILDALRPIGTEHYKPLEGGGPAPLSIARAYLAAGAADFITYESTGSKIEKASATASVARLQTTTQLTAEAQKSAKL